MRTPNKYALLFSLAWQNGFTYRFALFLWKIRNFVATLFSVTIWNVAFQNSPTLFNYSKAEMIGYVILISVVQSVILATALNDLPARIYSGELSKDLIKPFPILRSFAILEVADKSKNILFALVELGIIWVFLKPEIIIPSLTLVPLFLLWVFGGLWLYFWIQILFGVMGFWSPESWGPRFIFWMIIEFTGGRLFPLDILPLPLKQAVELTFLPYLSYAQVQLFLNHYTLNELIHHTALLFFWCSLLAIFGLHLWHKGNKDYAAAGH